MLPSCCVISARFKADQTDSGRQRNIQINVSQTLYQKGRAGPVINCEPGINFFLQLIVSSTSLSLPALLPSLTVPPSTKSACSLPEWNAAVEIAKLGM